MQTDFFAYSRQKIAKDKADGRCDVANNRGAALKCLSKFLGKEVWKVEKSEGFVKISQKP